MKYVSTKSYPNLGSVAYRQHRADSHCRLVHGYSLSFYFEFEAETLDARNWVMDFGGLRPLKEVLEEWFDHTLLVAEDDPHRDELIRLGELGLAKDCQAIFATLSKLLCPPLVVFVSGCDRKEYHDHQDYWQ